MASNSTATPVSKLTISVSAVLCETFFFGTNVFPIPIKDVTLNKG